jgi:hypothetical protein
MKITEPKKLKQRPPLKIICYSSSPTQIIKDKKGLKEAQLFFLLITPHTPY